MPEFFIKAQSFAAPFCSDPSEAYRDALTAEQALNEFAADYGHPAGLYYAAAYASADAFHKGFKPLAEYKSNLLATKDEATADKSAYSYTGTENGFIIDDRTYVVPNPREGSVV